MNEKSLAIASYLELKLLKNNWLFRVKFNNGNYTEGLFLPAKRLKSARCFPRTNWWFIEIQAPPVNVASLSAKISVDDIEEIDCIK